MTTAQFDGHEVVRWLGSAAHGNRDVLINAEYSDDDDIWTVHGVSASALLICKDGEAHGISRPYDFFSHGTFFLGSDAGLLLSAEITSSMSAAELRISKAKDFLSEQGFPISELGGDTVALLFADAISAFHSQRVLPADDQWDTVTEVLKSGSKTLMKLGAKHISLWLKATEDKRAGRIDLYRRTSLAALYRHAGQFEQALEICKAADLPVSQLDGGPASLSALLTTRAATLMDLSELQPSNRNDLLKEARSKLNRANAISIEDSDFIREAYQRLKSLDHNQ